MLSIIVLLVKLDLFSFALDGLFLLFSLLLNAGQLLLLIFRELLGYFKSIDIEGFARPVVLSNVHQSCLGPVSFLRNVLQILLLILFVLMIWHVHGTDAVFLDFKQVLIHLARDSLDLLVFRWVLRKEPIHLASLRIQS